MEKNQRLSSYYGRRGIEQELIRGREAANQLLAVFGHKSFSDGEGLMLPYVEDLARNILRSFTNSLLLLNNNDDDVSDEKVLLPQTEEDTDGKGTFVNAKKRRGCYKRKLNALTWEEDSSILNEDGYAWRKYGQKEIVKTKYLRSYYRCTYKHDQNCLATKQVQKIKDEPPLYRTTYYGHHNCKSALINPKIVMEPDSSTSRFLCFNNNNFPSKQEYPPLSSSPYFTSMKKENMEVIPEHHNIADYNQLSSSEYLLLWDYQLDSTIW